MKRGFYLGHDNELWLVGLNGKAEFYSIVSNSWEEWSGTKYALGTWLEVATYVGL